jgi:hypothetical protein
MLTLSLCEEIKGQNGFFPNQFHKTTTLDTGHSMCLHGVLMALFGIIYFLMEWQK